MTIREALAQARRRLHASASPALDARLLLQHVLQVGHSHLLAHDDRPLTVAQEQAFLDLVQRAARCEPIPYLTGRAPFYGRHFLVTPAVLIPRPETELLVESAAAWAAPRRRLRLVDVGVGSGCIAVTLAHLLPQAVVAAADISAPALDVARHNAARHGLAGRIRFHHGHLLEPVAAPLDLIVANLPYVARSEWTLVDDTVKWYEPAVALDGGEDGLDLVRELLRQARSRLSPGGAIFLEIGWRQGPAALEIAQAAFPDAQVKRLEDNAGRDRIVTVQQAVEATGSGQGR